MQTQESIAEKEVPQEYVSSMVADECLRYQIRKLIKEPEPDSFWKRISTNPLISVIVGFLLSGGIGLLLTNHYTNKQKDLEYQRTSFQKELERERSFADETNKVRLSKIGEVWEKVATYEAGVKAIKERISIEQVMVNGSPQRIINISESIANALQESKNLHEELIGLLDKNYFWLGEGIYDVFKNYIDTTYDFLLALASKDATTQTVESLERKRRLERPEINLLRDKMLKGEI